MRPLLRGLVLVLALTLVALSMAQARSFTGAHADAAGREIIVVVSCGGVRHGRAHSKPHHGYGKS
jgi:hypothetical protein